MKKYTKEAVTIIAAILGVNIGYFSYKIQLLIIGLAFLYLIISTIYMCINGINKYDLYIRFITAILGITLAAYIIIKNILVNFSRYENALLILIVCLMITMIIIAVFKSRKYK